MASSVHAGVRAQGTGRALVAAGQLPKPKPAPPKLQKKLSKKVMTRPQQLEAMRHQDTLAPTKRADPSKRSTPQAVLRTSAVKNYTVKKNDNFEVIARRLGVRRRPMERLNRDVAPDPSRLSIGLVLKVPNERPMLVTKHDHLSHAPDHRFDPKELRRVCGDAGRRHGVDPKVLLGIIFQESTFVNRLIHADGHGTGLVGLDPRGELGDFELWSKRKLLNAAGQRRALPPELQIEFLALRLRELREDRGGDLWGAVSAWHTGGRFDPGYVLLVKGRMAELEGGGG